MPTLIKSQSSNSNNTQFLRKTAPAVAPANDEPVTFSPIFKKNAFKMKKQVEPEVKPMVSTSFIHGTVVENCQFVTVLADLVMGSLMKVWFSEKFWPKTTGYNRVF